MSYSQRSGSCRPRAGPYRTVREGLAVGRAAAVAHPRDRMMGAVGHRSSIGSRATAGRHLVSLERFVGVVAAATVVWRSAFVGLATFVRVVARSAARYVVVGLPTRGPGPATRLQIVLGRPRTGASGPDERSLGSARLALFVAVRVLDRLTAWRRLGVGSFSSSCEREKTPANMAANPFELAVGNWLPLQAAPFPRTGHRQTTAPALSAAHRLRSTASAGTAPPADRHS